MALCRFLNSRPCFRLRLVTPGWREGSPRRPLRLPKGQSPCRVGSRSGRELSHIRVRRMPRGSDTKHFPPTRMQHDDPARAACDIVVPRLPRLPTFFFLVFFRDLPSSESLRPSHLFPQQQQQQLSILKRGGFNIHFVRSRRFFSELFCGANMARPPVLSTLADDFGASDHETAPTFTKEGNSRRAERLPRVCARRRWEWQDLLVARVCRERIRRRGQAGGNRSESSSGGGGAGSRWHEGRRACDDDHGEGNDDWARERQERRELCRGRRWGTVPRGEFSAICVHACAMASSIRCIHGLHGNEQVQNSPSPPARSSKSLARRTNRKCCGTRRSSNSPTCSSLCTTRATPTVSAMSRICGCVSLTAVTIRGRRPLTIASFASLPPRTATIQARRYPDAVRSDQE